MQKQFLDNEEAESSLYCKTIKFRFAPKLPNICIKQKCSMGVWSLRILYSLNLNGGLGVSPQRLATLGIYYQNNPFLGMFQLKFCLKTFGTCSLLYISVFKSSILAIILVEYLLFDPSAKKRPQIVQGAKKFQGNMSPPSSYFPRLWDTLSGATIIQQCFKRH